LRSFDAHDADFFLELLPGPRDRDGLPDSIRFWKTRIEEMDADNTFSVGLIYGPSGCGKSSPVKAGLLPRLSGSVLPIYVAATGDETESRLLKGLRKHCPVLPGHLGLIEALTALRRERFHSSRRRDSTGSSKCTRLACSPRMVSSLVILIQLLPWRSPYSFSKPVLHDYLPGVG
jgi:hypothetical protein